MSPRLVSPAGMSRTRGTLPPHFPRMVCVGEGGESEVVLLDLLFVCRACWHAWLTFISIAPQAVASHTASLSEVSWSPLLVSSAGPTSSTCSSHVVCAAGAATHVARWHTGPTTFFYASQEVASRNVSIPAASWLLSWPSCLGIDTRVDRHVLIRAARCCLQRGLVPEASWSPRLVTWASLPRTRGFLRSHRHRKLLRLKKVAIPRPSCMPLLVFPAGHAVPARHHLSLHRKVVRRTKCPERCSPRLSGVICGGFGCRSHPPGSSFGPY